MLCGPCNSVTTHLYSEAKPGTKGPSLFPVIPPHHVISLSHLSLLPFPHVPSTHCVSMCLCVLACICVLGDGGVGVGGLFM